eukprot:CAMPEP_0201515956 /NCGR_PEP_ID=MMETSP0161_2-20130828/7398_1 /ASSEMBLY_ACC=CAM_ASM_000251 /TAXON_ID=180227 /ORGANISM="Neoparamoeba aestuarina, Strain SoJaBio B1-5/56/2" /LENGTH=35 /DNA_ID= /DNA_START= /DNA_END= /DNA_ORIENTATION=
MTIQTWSKALFNILFVFVSKRRKRREEKKKKKKKK